jgi:hypothetical protein
MILVTNVVFLLATIVSGAFKKWKTYYETIIFVSFCNLLYNFLCKDRLTWSYQPDILLNHKTADLVTTLVLLPATITLYLHFFPTNKLKKIFYYLGWIAGFSALEYIWYLFGYITYNYGWNLLWSIGFYFVMFYTIILHHTNLKIALLLSLFSVVFLVITFKIPI